MNLTTFKANIKEFFRVNHKIFRFTSFELVISGYLMAMFLVIAFIFKTSLPRRFNIAFELPFYVLIGIILSWFKGAIVAFSFDFGKLLLTSRVFFWTPEYGIVPILVAIFSSLAFNFANKNKKVLIFLLILTYLITFSVFIFYFFMSESEIQRVAKDWKRLFNKKLVLLLIGIFGVILLAFTTFLVILYWKRPTQKFKNAIITLFVLSICFLVFRWLWHPFAFVQYYNRFLNRSGRDRLIENYFFFYLTPIILKSTISFPIYSLFLINIVPLIQFLNDKHNFRWKFGY
ncbi:ECF transporter S component [Mesomycoplasma ovipneumoniae]|uniref:ECF transporter S component n=1 Tax=Mesomycoplasma ovipneumoniae TaxID=29562 RepID=UPI002964854A|nr:ECF transporter S component [Mesomycoplasma ovipneumoniae]MDW2917186.1 ECF transporter S component [Mesomycoplasma ovipneumoniae]